MNMLLDFVPAISLADDEVDFKHYLVILYLTAVLMMVVLVEIHSQYVATRCYSNLINRRWNKTWKHHPVALYQLLLLIVIV